MFPFSSPRPRSANSARVSSHVSWRWGQQSTKQQAGNLSQSETKSAWMKKRSPVTYKSGVCGHFGFYKEMVSLRNAICKMCRAAIKHTGSTTNLSSHLKRRHGVNVTERSPSAPVVSTSGGTAANTMLVFVSLRGYT